MALRYRFGEYVLDVQRHTLHRGEHEIPQVRVTKLTLTSATRSRREEM